MRSRMMVASMLALVAVGVAVSPVWSQDEKKGPPEGMNEKAMAEIMARMQPGPHHKHLEPLVGKWKYDLKWWMPGVPEGETSGGTSEFKWALDGMQLMQDVEGPEEFGKPFRGLGIYGYDNIAGRYHSMWFDNMGTGCWVLYGECDKDGKVLTFKGEVADAMTGEKAQKIRNVLKIESKDRATFESFVVMKDGKEHRQMEIIYTRPGAK